MMPLTRDEIQTLCDFLNNSCQSIAGSDIRGKLLQYLDELEQLSSKEEEWLS